MVRVGINDQLTTVILSESRIFKFEFMAQAQSQLTVELINKPAADSTQAVIVESVEFFGITDPKFVWAGTYTPVYPEPWASEQSGPLPKQLLGQGYLGWNGTWQLTFSVPVFTWIHQIQDLGWVY